MEQVELTVEDDPSFQRPLPHVGPLSVTQENDDMISFLARILKVGDIDLGSQCTYFFSQIPTQNAGNLIFLFSSSFSRLLSWICWKLSRR